MAAHVRHTHVRLQRPVQRGQQQRPQLIWRQQRPFQVHTFLQFGEVFLKRFCRTSMAPPPTFNGAIKDQLMLRVYVHSSLKIKSTFLANGFIIFFLFSK